MAEHMSLLFHMQSGSLCLNSILIQRRMFLAVYPFLDYLISWHSLFYTVLLNLFFF